MNDIIKIKCILLKNRESEEARRIKMKLRRALKECVFQEKTDQPVEVSNEDKLQKFTMLL